MFRKAVHELAGDGSQRERLINAYRNNLTHLDKHDLPETLQEDFQKLREIITRMDPGIEGRVITTVKAMEHTEVTNLVETIISIYDRLQSRSV